MLAAGFGGALELLADVVSHPAYRDVEVAAAAESLAAGTAGRGPHARRRRALLRHRFGPHPISAAPATPAELLDVTPDDLHLLHVDAIVPTGSVLLILGPAEPTEALADVTEVFGSLQGAESGLRLPALTAPSLDGGPTSLAAEPGTSALVTTMGPGLPTSHPEHPALHLANLVLGGSGAARLSKRVREELGLAYFVGSSLEDTGAGAWSGVDVTTAPGNGTRVACEVTACMADLANHGPTEQEIEDARRFAAGFAEIGLSTRAETASAATGFVLRGLPPDWLHGYLARVNSVTAAEVTAAARHWDPASHSIAVCDVHENSTAGDAR